MGMQDLSQALQKRQVRSLRGVWRAMIDSVQVVHDERVVHGDLKPANFLMVKKELKLIDFGIAKQIENNDTTNIVRENAIGKCFRLLTLRSRSRSMLLPTFCVRTRSVCAEAYWLWDRTRN